MKKLADTLNKKTSTIYHRLQRLKSNNVILGYSIIFNPDFLNIEKIAIQKVKVKPLNISSLDDMFLKSFASFINNEFPQVLFIALSEDSKVIYLISVHITEKDHVEFISKLQNNPYIEEIETEFISEIIKGQKIFNFNKNWLQVKKKKPKKAVNGPSFDDLEDDGADEEERTFEVSLDDDEFDDIKF